jgi:hypothetical protein
MDISSIFASLVHWHFDLIFPCLNVMVNSFICKNYTSAGKFDVLDM